MNRLLLCYSTIIAASSLLIAGCSKDEAGATNETKSQVANEVPKTNQKAQADFGGGVQPATPMKPPTGPDGAAP